MFESRAVENKTFYNFLVFAVTFLNTASSPEIMVRKVQFTFLLKLKCEVLEMV